MLLTKSWPGLSPSVMSGCCSLSVHHYCQSLWRAPREWGQATAGPGFKSETLPVISVTSRYEDHKSRVITFSVTLYKSPATFCLSFSSVSSLDRVSVSWVFSCNENKQSADVQQHFIGGRGGNLPLEFCSRQEDNFLSILGPIESSIFAHPQQFQCVLLRPCWNQK